METDIDIASAWKLVEKFIEAGWEVCVEYANWNEVEEANLLAQPLEYSWVCSLAYYTDLPAEHKYHSCKADTASLAIRRAVQLAEKGEG